MIVNKLHWVASKSADPHIFSDLHERMEKFYSSFEQRDYYQHLNDESHETQNSVSVFANTLVDYILKSGFRNVIEFGCGSGKVYKRLSEQGYKGKYTGVEVAQYVIESNAKAYPNANWKTSTIYSREFPTEEYDLCFAFFVLEHLVYPEKALDNIMRLVKNGGSIMLVFPDFVRSKIVPSQKLGLSIGGSTSDKLRKGKLTDAVITYLEGHSMRKIVGSLQDRIGKFVINTNPVCLMENCKELIPDMDAIHLSNRDDIESWARSRNYQVNYPSGQEGIFCVNAFIEIKKTANQ